MSAPRHRLCAPRVENANEKSLMLKSGRATSRVVRMARKALVPGPVTQWVEIDKLSPGNNQRVFFLGIVELANQIEASGRIVPLDIARSGRIIAGERRYRAACLLNENAKKNRKKLPWPMLEVRVLDLTDQETLDWNVQENLGRSDFRFIELARIFLAYRETGLNNRQIMAKTGYNEDTVGRYLNILEKAHPDIIARLDKGEIIPTDLLITLHTIKPQDIQLVRLEQWLGNPVTESETVKTRERRSVLPRRKLMQLIKLMGEANYPPEAIQTVQFIVGARDSLPGKIHQKLSHRRPRQVRE